MQSLVETVSKMTLFNEAFVLMPAGDIASTRDIICRA